jgi:hypothetical protein
VDPVAQATKIVFEIVLVGSTVKHCERRRLGSSH